MNFSFSHNVSLLTIKPGIPIFVYQQSPFIVIESPPKTNKQTPNHWAISSPAKQRMSSGHRLSTKNKPCWIWAPWSLCLMEQNFKVVDQGKLSFIKISNNYIYDRSFMSRWFLRVKDGRMQGIKSCWCMLCVVSMRWVDCSTHCVGGCMPDCRTLNLQRHRAKSWLFHSFHW